MDQIERVQIDNYLSFLKRYNECKIDLKKENKIVSMIKNASLFGSQSNSNAFAKSFPVVESLKNICMGKINEINLENPIDSSLNQIEVIENVYVFIIGPGNYVEYNGLMELGKQKTKKY